MFDPLTLTRGLHLAATALASGTVCFMVLVLEPAARAMLPSPPDGFPALRRRLIVTTWMALALTILSGAVWLVLLAADVIGSSVADVARDGGLWQFASATRFGQVAGARLLLALGLGVLMLRPGLRLLHLAAAAMLIALLGMTGHAGATPGLAGDVHRAADMVHLLAAGAWLGTLPGLVLLLSQAQGGNDPAWPYLARDVAQRFSVLGTIAVGVLLASGLANGWYLIATPRDLLATDYGRLLLFKIALFAAMVTIAAVNKYRLTPRLAAPRSFLALQLNTAAEIVLGLGVLLLAGALGGMDPAGHVHTAAPEASADVAYVHMHDGTVMADVTITPGRAGRAAATVRLMRENGTEFPASELTLTLDPPAPGLQTVRRTVRRNADGIWQAEDIEIPQAGIWTLRVILTVPAGPIIVLDAPVVIEP